MFQNRGEESGRRPSADLLARFKEQHFSPDGSSLGPHDPLKKEPSSDPEMANMHSMYDLDPTPKPSGCVPFRLTPSLLDPNSTAFAAFAAQPPGYYTPTPGGSSLGFHSYDLPVNSQAFNTPDSLSHPNANAMHPPSIFDPHLNAMENANYMHFRTHHPYAQESYHTISIPGSAVGGAGSESSSNYSPETGSATSNPDPSEPELYIPPEIQGKFLNAQINGGVPEIYGQYISKSLICSSLCRFRFATTLHAATAMLRHPNDIPVTYLNKRQAYIISVVDTSSAVQNTELKRYKTTVRIAFDEEEQRRTAPACWRLWKDGRGTLESGGNPDKLRAIDYDATETRAANEKKSNSDTTLQVEEASTSFDRFTVTWSSTSSQPTVYFSLRFLFLSTDFSHSKGVKGVPVRLVAKTELIGTSNTTYQSPLASELAYCKIKLFRDKGAERKLANDRQHLERAIEKLRQQAHQSQNGSPDQNSNMMKKKRHSFTAASTAAGGEPTQTSPQRRHKRDWSISSTASNASVGGNPKVPSDEIERKRDKVQAMEAMFHSIRQVSVFSLIGDRVDDPSVSFSPIAPQTQWDAPGVYPSDSVTAQRGSPALSQASFSSVTSEKLAFAGASPHVHPLSPPDGGRRMSAIVPSQLSQKVHIQAVTKDIDAIDVDPFYVPIPRPTIHPALCVYIAPAKIGPTGDPHTMHLPNAIDPTNDIYYAVYVPNRTAISLTSSIAIKMGINPAEIVRTTIVSKRGLRLVLDDEVAREMLEKQDMRVTVREIETSPPPTSQQGGDTGVNERRRGLELLLAF